MTEPPPADDSTGYAVTPEGVFLPHDVWTGLLTSISNLSAQNEKLLRTVADLLARSGDPYDLAALRDLL